MKTQHGDSKVGTEGHKTKLFRNESGNWHKDSKNLKEGDILIEETSIEKPGVLSRSGVKSLKE